MKVAIDFVFSFFFFKQRTAYEILSGLVGSEMCIKDSLKGLFEPHHYELLGTVKRSGFLHLLQVAVFKKSSA